MVCAFAMAHRPKLYLLDEATAGLDPVYRIEFFNVLRRMLAEDELDLSILAF